MTVVVVKPDDLSAWIGIAGVVVGVILASGIDVVRGRMKARAERTRALYEGGTNLALAGRSYLRTRAAAGGDAGKQPWIEMIDAREEAVDAEYYKIVANISNRALPAGSRRGRSAVALLEAATTLRDVCARWPRPGETEGELVAKQHAALDDWFRLVEEKNLVAYDRPSGDSPPGPTGRAQNPPTGLNEG